MAKLRSLAKKLRLPKSWRFGLTLLLLTPYGLYLAYMVTTGVAPIDYLTFMDIGERLLAGARVYGENSYYPLPYVGVFSFFAALPRPVSIALWFGLPLVVVLVASGFHPYALAFAPTLSHFLGGQSAVFGLLGFWGYRNHLALSNWKGGVFLALSTLKPQLAVVPLAYAVYHWGRAFRTRREISTQLQAFAVTFIVIYLPAFIVDPAWVGKWLGSPRPLFARALSAAVPRLLLTALEPSSLSYWLVWLAVSAVLLWGVWRFKGNAPALDVLLLWSFMVSPLVHDYDLIQVIPTIWGPVMKVAAVVLSAPGWWTIFARYAQDAAWVTFTLIAPGLLAVYLLQCRHGLGTADAPRECRSEA